MTSGKQFLAKCLLSLGLGLLLLLLHFILDFNGLYGQDGYEYLRYSRALHEFYRHGAMPGNMVLPMFYPFVASLASLFTNAPVFWLQFISIASYVAGFFYLRGILKELYGENKGYDIYLLLFFAFSPYVFRFSLLVMSDMFALMLCTGAFYHVLKYAGGKRAYDFTAVAAFSLMACLTRNACAGLLVIPMGYSLWVLVRYFRPWALLGATVIVALLLIPDSFFRQKLFVFGINATAAQYNYTNIHPYWSILNFFRHDFQTVDDHQHYSQPNIIHVFFHLFHPAYFFAGLILIFFFRKEDLKNRYIILLAASLLCYSIFLAGFDFQNMRNMLIAFPLVPVLFYRPAMRVWIRLKQHRMAVIVIIAVLAAQMCLSAYTFRTVWMENRFEKEIVNEIRKHPGQPIYAIGYAEMLKQNGISNPVENIWYSPIEMPKTGSLILINPVKTSNQFANHNAAANWNFMKSYCRISVLKDFGQGLQLMQIQQCR